MACSLYSCLILPLCSGYGNALSFKVNWFLKKHLLILANSFGYKCIISTHAQLRNYMRRYWVQFIVRGEWGVKLCGYFSFFWMVRTGPRDMMIGSVITLVTAFDTLSKLCPFHHNTKKTITVVSVHYYSIMYFKLNKYPNSYASA